MVEIHIPRQASVVVAASDSLSKSADYVCDGTADDVQLQAAIDAVEASNGGDVYCLDGNYDINATVVVKATVRLILSHGAIFKPESDVNLVQLEPDAQISGGLFDATGTFTSACIYLDGADSFVQNHKTMIENVRFIGDEGTGTGTAIYFFCEASGENVTFVTVRDIFIDNFEYGIRLRCEKAVEAGTDAFINGNRFSNIRGDGVVNFIHISLANTDYNAIGYNNFHSCVISCSIAAQAYGFYSDGEKSIVELECIDEATPTTWKSINLTVNGKRNYITLLGYNTYISNSGTWNTIYNREQASATPRFILGGLIQVMEGEHYIADGYGLRIGEKGYTSSGAIITQGVVNIASGGSLAMTLADPGSAGKHLLIHTTNAGTGHTVTTATAGGFDGTNNTATFNATTDVLYLISIDATHWAVIANIGVVLSAV